MPYSSSWGEESLLDAPDKREAEVTPLLPYSSPPPLHATSQTSLDSYELFHSFTPLSVAYLFGTKRRAHHAQQPRTQG